MTIPTLQVFTFVPGLNLRSFERNGAAWFLAMDVSKALDYSDAFEMTKRLDDDEKQNLQIAGFSSRGVTFISESGLYAAILGSHKPEAKAFKKWVTAVVLPSIRKHGAYAEGSEHLPVQVQANLYAHFQAQVREALRRHDKDTQHDHWAPQEKQKVRSVVAAEKIARDMGLPFAAVVAATSYGVEGGLKSLTLELTDGPRALQSAPW